MTEPKEPPRYNLAGYQRPDGEFVYYCDYQALQSELEKVKAELESSRLVSFKSYDELLKESLELSKFYGDITNWESGDDYVNSIIDITDMERIENIIEGADCSDDFGGKRARDFLRKWDKNGRI